MRKVLTGSLLALTVALSTWHVAVNAAPSASGAYRVTNIPAGQALNLRSGAGTSASIVKKIPANTGGIVPTGEEKTVSGITWVKVYWSGIGGWVSKKYITKDTGVAAPTKPAPQPSTPAAATQSTGKVMNCSGTEPFWSMDIAEKSLKINMLYGSKFTVPVAFRQTSANNPTIAVISGSASGNSLSATLQKVDSCSDGMSDHKFPYAITAVVNGRKVISGCCGVQ